MAQWGPAGPPGARGLRQLPCLPLGGSAPVNSDSLSLSLAPLLASYLTVHKLRNLWSIDVSAINNLATINNLSAINNILATSSRIGWKCRISRFRRSETRQQRHRQQQQQKVESLPWKTKERRRQDDVHERNRSSGQNQDYQDDLRLCFQ